MSARDEICEFHGIEVFYGDDGTVGRHIHDGDKFDTASQPGWYYALAESKGDGFASNMYGPFDSRKATVKAMTSDLADML